MLKNVLVTGGAGYVGHVLVPRLLADGYNVTVYDLLFFGSRLPNHPNLRVIKGDIRDTARLATCLKGQDAVLHLACISNDASFELDENLSKTINYDCFEPMVVAARKAGVKRFVYCSTSSVYGVSDAPDVTEDHPLVPLTLYNKFKGMCEPLLWQHKADDFTCVTVRPATICGYSPRTRLDLSVNILTNHAVNKGVITVFGGKQMRPNLHIEDMVDAYRLMLTAPHDKIHGETFNIGFENHAIADLATMVKSVVEAQGSREIDIVTTPSDDNRSYHVNSDKIRRVLGYAPARTIEDAMRDLTRAFVNHLLPNSFDDDWYYNVRTMKKLGAR
ncbi:SDR family oxidoreductase [Bradyrhizobium sp. BR13661]|jgi:nucleoside-diphosphate-sugar epimerase|uniref:NAD-dependent epimerase/dehydratase family protein n=1 Tax=Bradyrhizobium sp. BR13661 TaxID=2940622 RepID=UPI002476E1D9|nr:SDR family oxidoreductase [Bradyrhizobium sp. BR13661]MDH6260327.1 nucleoside-diphosphate-sugar epimerase [Bradyrhizobium sp. BR13661]